MPTATAILSTPVCDPITGAAPTTSAPAITETDLTDAALRALSGAALADRLQAARRMAEFLGACERGADLTAERFWSRAYARFRLETVRRQGPVIQSAGTLLDKVVSCRRAHAGELATLTRDGRAVVDALRSARSRARATVQVTVRAGHRFEARLMAARLARINGKRRALRKLISGADATLAETGAQP